MNKIIMVLLLAATMVLSACSTEEEIEHEELEVVVRQEEEAEAEESGMNTRTLIVVEFVEQDGEYAVCRDKDGITYRVKTDKFMNSQVGERLMLEYDTEEVEEIEENAFVINDGILSPGTPLKSMK